MLSDFISRKILEEGELNFVEFNIDDFNRNYLV